jgi:hypothetical protein
MKPISATLLAALLASCVYGDDNDAPVYGRDYGLPVNCRAYVQAAIDGYRSKQYSADDSMAGLERNCGANGSAWKNNR